MLSIFTEECEIKIALHLDILLLRKKNVFLKSQKQMREVLTPTI